ncbi:hypothetical protein [Rubripirellula obstinata]|nr:hypothetical protein [Rubripirellula obstinata]
MTFSFRWLLFRASVCVLATLCSIENSFADGGVLNFSLSDESTSEPVISRVELWRPESQRKGRPLALMPVRKTVPAGIGMVVDRSVELSLPEGAYRFRIVRGPEYRIISGDFSLEKTSLDDHHVDLPRMVNMLAEGWVSGDCLVPPSAYSFPLRMASEDLHVATVAGEIPARPIAGRGDDDPIVFDPTWIRHDAAFLDGLAIIGPSKAIDDELPIDTLLRCKESSDVVSVIENPFAWQLPVWLATEKIDGVFVLGDWLRLDRKVMRVAGGRSVQSLMKCHAQAVGQWAETIYHQMLEAGLQIAPMAGSGDGSGKTPIGYNRTYVTTSARSYGEQDDQPTAPASVNEWWLAAIAGQSVVTNGPCLRPTLAGKIPGHVFEATAGEVLNLRPELRLAVRDPVDYLDVIHNGTVRYSARLDEFAKAGGQIPPLEIKESGWVIVRVVTAHEDHLRAAFSAPWYIVYDDQPRVTAESVKFFADWLKEYERRLLDLPADDLRKHIPHVKRARQFWSSKTPTIQ